MAQFDSSPVTTPLDISGPQSVPAGARVDLPNIASTEAIISALAQNPVAQRQIADQIFVCGINLTPTGGHSTGLVRSAIQLSHVAQIAESPVRDTMKHYGLTVPDAEPGKEHLPPSFIGVASSIEAIRDLTFSYAVNAIVEDEKNRGAREPLSLGESMIKHSSPKGEIPLSVGA